MSDNNKQNEVIEITDDLGTVIIADDSFLNPDEKEGYKEWKARKIKSKSKAADAW